MLNKISFFNIIERIENGIALQYVFEMFMAITLCVYYLSRQMKKIVNTKGITVSTVILISIGSIFIFKGSPNAMDFYEKKIFYVFTATIILPMILSAIGLKIKEKFPK